VDYARDVAILQGAPDSLGIAYICFNEYRGFRILRLLKRRDIQQNTAVFALSGEVVGYMITQEASPTGYSYALGGSVYRRPASTVK